MCVGEQAPKSSKYDFSKIYIQNYKNQKILGRVRWVRWVRYMYGEPSKPSDPANPVNPPQTSKIQIFC